MRSVPAPFDARAAAVALRAPDARVAIAGVSGSGKSTLARQLASALDLPYTEIDGLHWGPDWTPRPSFADEVRGLVAHDRWITEWQYRRVRPLIIERATVLLWLDPPFRVTLWRVIRRTVRRRVRREVLWNGNLEPGLRHAVFHPEGIIRWAAMTRHKYRALIAQTLDERPGLTVIRLRTPRETRALLAALSTTQD